MNPIASYFRRYYAEIEEGYDPADNSRKSYQVAIGEMRRRLESFRCEEIGPHKLYLGDCTQIMPLLGKADIVVTDPPYGVDYTGGHFHSGNVNIKRERERLAGDAEPDWDEWVRLIFGAVDGPCYIFHAGTKAAPLHNAVLRNGGTIHALIVWHKTNATYAAMNAQYKQRHEPILYCKPKNSTLRWVGDSAQATVWEIPRDPSNVYHPTQKPVDVMAKAIRNHDAKRVLDPFMGAGSTGCAAAKLGRHFVGIEINPTYFEIACKRVSDAMSQPDMFVTQPAPAPEQLALLESS